MPSHESVGLIGAPKRAKCEHVGCYRDALHEHRDQGYCTGHFPLYRDGWHCTATVTHRITGELGRCPVVGSEMVACAGRTFCPRHAKEAGW